MIMWLKSFLYAPPACLPHSELFKGVTKPSVTLAHMLVAEMLQNLDVKCDLCSDVTSLMRFPSFSFKVYTSSYFERVGGMSLDRLDIRDLVFKRGHVPSFSADEKKIILSGWLKFLDLIKKDQAIREEADRQQKAIDAIAKLAGVPEPETPSIEVRKGEEWSAHITTE